MESYESKSWCGEIKYYIDKYILKKDIEWKIVIMNTY